MAKLSPKQKGALVKVRKIIEALENSEEVFSSSYIVDKSKTIDMKTITLTLKVKNKKKTKKGV